MPNPMKVPRQRSKPPSSSKRPASATIFDQLGGNRFIIMTGAKQFVALDKGLQFGIPRSLTKDNINKVRITVTPADLYDVEFFNIRGTKIKKVREAKGIQVSELRRVFRANTGLDTNL